MRLFWSESKQWRTGFISGDDTHCYVYCQCGGHFSATDYKITVCPLCGRGYVTEFRCYRIPRLVLNVEAALLDLMGEPITWDPAEDAFKDGKGDDK